MWNSLAKRLRCIPVPVDLDVAHMVLSIERLEAAIMDSILPREGALWITAGPVFSGSIERLQISPCAETNYVSR